MSEREKYYKRLNDREDARQKAAKRAKRVKPEKKESSFYDDHGYGDESSW